MNSPVDGECDEPGAADEFLQCLSGLVHPPQNALPQLIARRHGVTVVEAVDEEQKGATLDHTQRHLTIDHPIDEPFVDGGHCRER